MAKAFIDYFFFFCYSLVIFIYYFMIKLVKVKYSHEEKYYLENNKVKCLQLTYCIKIVYIFLFVRHYFTMRMKLR